MSYFIMMLLAGIGNGMGDFFSKLAAGKMSPYLAAMIMSVSALCTVAVYFFLVRHQAGNLVLTKAGVGYAILGGLSIGVGMVFFFNLFAKGVNITQAQPIIKSVVVLSAVLLGAIVLKEKMTVSQIIGLLLSVAGIYFLAK